MNLQEKKDRKCTYNVILRNFRLTILLWTRNEHYTILGCVFVALRIPYAMRIRHIVI